MLVFWTAVGLLSCFAIAALIWPLFRRSRPGASGGPADEARRLEVYRQRRREIEAERDAGRLSADEASRALDELAADAQSQFADPATSEAPVTASEGSPTMRWLVALAVAVFVPGVALLVYLPLGSPDTVAMDPKALRAPPSTASRGVPELTPERIENAIAQLRASVEAEPRDPRGWSLLASAQQLKGDLTGALETLQKATATIPDNARLWADYAQALAAVQGNFGGKVGEAVQRALALDGRELKALDLMARASYDAGQLKDTLGYLRRMREQFEDGSEPARELEQIMAGIESEISGKPAVPPVARADAPAAPPAAAPAVPPAAAAAKPAAAPARTDPKPAASGAGKTVSGSIDIDPRLREGLPDAAVLFVVARASEGPRTPLAVLRVPVPSRWPMSFELGDAQAMDPSRPLSSVPQVIVEARVSLTGNAIRASGDPIGTSEALAPGARDLRLRIDRKVP